MIENKFQHFVRAVSVAAGERNPELVIETLADGVGELPFGAEIIEQKLFVRTKHAGDFLHGSEARAESGACPHLQEGCCPEDALVVPEVAERFLQFPSASGLAQAPKHDVELVTRATPDSGPSFKQEEATTFDLEFLAGRAQPASLATAHQVHGVVEMLGDMEGIEDVECCAGHFRDDRQIRLPHIRANHLESLEKAVVGVLQKREPLPERGLRAALADPKQTAAVGVDLVNESDKVLAPLAASPMKFVDAQGGHTFQGSMLQAPLHDPLHRAAHRIPTGLENARRFLPRKPPGPPGQEEPVGRGIRMFALCPRQMLDSNSTERTLHSPRGVAQHEEHLPQRDKQPLPLGQTVVARSRTPTTRAASLPARMRFQLGFNVRVTAQANALDDESAEVLHAAQKGFNGQLDGGMWVGGFLALNTASQSPLPPSASRRFSQPGFGFAKTPSKTSAPPAAQVKRDGGINPRSPHYRRWSSRFYAAVPLDRSEDGRAMSPQNHPQILRRNHKIELEAFA